MESVSVAGRLVLLMLRMNLPLVSPPLILLVVILWVDFSLYRDKLNDAPSTFCILSSQDNYGTFLFEFSQHIPGILSY